MATAKSPGERPQTALELMSLLGPYRPTEESRAVLKRRAGDNAATVRGFVTPNSEMISHLRQALRESSGSEPVPPTIARGTLAAVVPPTIRADAEELAGTRAGTRAETVPPTGRGPFLKWFVLGALAIVLVGLGGYAVSRLGGGGPDAAELARAFDEGREGVRRPGTLERGVDRLLWVKEQDPDYPGLADELGPALVELSRRLLEDGHLARAWDCLDDASDLRPEEEIAPLRETARTAIVQALAGALTVNAPVDGAFVTEPGVAVDGLVDTDALHLRGLDDSRLRVAGEDVRVVAGAFHATAKLEEGKQDLRIGLALEEGLEAEVVLTVTLDTSNPEIIVVSPDTNGFVDGSPAMATGRVRDAGIREVSIRVEGPENRTLAAQLTPEDEGAAWSVPLDLMEGNYRLIATAVDAAGRRSEATRELVIDRTRPTIYVDALPRAVAEANQRIQGTVADPNLARLELLIVEGDEPSEGPGRPVTVDAEGRFGVALALERGDNAFLLRAVDRAGNVETRAIGIRLEDLQLCIDEAQAAIAQGRIDAAERSLGRALELDAGSARARRLRAVLRALGGDDRAAAEDLAALEKGGDGVATDLLNRAVVAWRVAATGGRAAGGPPAGALEDLDRARQREERNAVILATLAAARLHRNEIDAAAAAAEKAVSIDPALAVAHNNLGCVRLAQGRAADALTSFDRALGADPAFGVAQLNRAVARLRAGDKSGAGSDLSRARGLGAAPAEGGPPMPHLRAAALDTLNPLLAVAMESPFTAELGTLVFDKALALHLAGDHAAAARAFAGISDLGAEGQLLLVRAQLAFGDPKAVEAGRLRARTLAVDKTFTPAQTEEARMLWASSELAQVVAVGGGASHANALTKLSDGLVVADRIPLRMERAVALMAKGEYSRAKSDLDAILRAEPFNAAALSMRARCHGVSGGEAARLDARKSYALDPSRNWLLSLMQTWYVVMHKTTRPLQRYHQVPVWPPANDPTDAQTMKDGYAVMEISPATPFWTVMWEKPTSAFQQRINVSPTLPEEWIKARWAENFRLWSIGFANGKVTTVMRQTPVTGQMRQTYLIRDDFPSEWIKEKAGEDLRLDIVAPISATQKIYVMNQYPGRKHPGQAWNATDAFPDKYLQERAQAGYRPTTLVHDGKKWIVVCTYDSTVKEQRILSGASFPRDAVKKGWDEGFVLITSAMGPDYAAPSPYAGSAYAFFDRREWVSTRYALQAQISRDNTRADTMVYLLFRRMMADLRTGVPLETVRREALMNRAWAGANLNEWSRAIMDFFCGDLSEEALLATAGTNKEHLCEGCYYAAEIRRASGDAAGSKRLLERCVAQGVTNFTEHTSAKAELGLK
ncbi:MAG: hypothetical protein R3F20_05435 [Planctomycetota bacterium]